MKLNKKAGGVPAGIFAILMLIFIIVIIILGSVLLLYGCAQERAKETEIKIASENLDLDMMLINILKTPLSADGINLNFADVAVLSLYDPSYNDLLNNKMRTSFAQFPHYYAVQIIKGDIKRTMGPSSAVSGSSALIEIPAPDYGIIQFKLYRAEK